VASSHTHTHTHISFHPHTFNCLLRQKCRMICLRLSSDDSEGAFPAAYFSAPRLYTCVGARSTHVCPCPCVCVSFGWLEIFMEQGASLPFIQLLPWPLFTLSLPAKCLDFKKFSPFAYEICSEMRTRITGHMQPALVSFMPARAE